MGVPAARLCWRRSLAVLCHANVNVLPTRTRRVLYGHKARVGRSGCAAGGRSVPGTEGACGCPGATALLHHPPSPPPHPFWKLISSSRIDQAELNFGFSLLFLRACRVSREGLVPRGGNPSPSGFAEVSRGCCAPGAGRP